MQSNLIAAEDFCRHHQIEVSFLHQLQDYGLAEVVLVHNQVFIDENHLSAIEKWRRLHYDLHINMEGLHAISHLLQRVEALQQEVALLRSRLRTPGPEPEATDVFPV